MELNGHEVEDRIRRGVALKNEYYDLFNTVEQLEETQNTGTSTLEVLGNVFKRLDLIGKTHNFRERIEEAGTTGNLDAAILSSASGIFRKCIENLEICDSAYDLSEYAEKVLEYVNKDSEVNNRDNWLNLFEDAKAIINETPKLSFLYGTFDPSELPQPKEKKERIRKATQEPVEKQQLQKTDNVVNTDDDAANQENFILKVLTQEFRRNRRQPLSYFDFVIDNEDFAATIENIFYTSFLIKSGKAKYSEDKDDNFPTIEPTTSEHLESYRQTGGEDFQCVISLDMDDWMQLKSEQPGLIQKHKTSQ